MPKYSNSFRRHEYHEEAILDEGGRLLGTIRVKPSTVLWKPNGARAFLAVSLDKFAAWIASPATNATRVTN